MRSNHWIFFFIESYLRTCCLLLVSTVRCNTLGSTWQKPIKFAKTTNKSGCSPLHSAALDPVYLSLAPSWNVMTYNTQLLWERTNHAIQVMKYKHNSYEKEPTMPFRSWYTNITLIKRRPPMSPTKFRVYFYTYQRHNTYSLHAKNLH